MNERWAVVLVAVLLACGGGQLRAQNLAFDIRAEKKKLNVTAKSDDGVSQTRNEEWGYEVKIANKSFKDVSDLRVEYLVFSKDVEPGSTGKPKLVRQKGEHQIEQIANNKITTFTTKPIELEKSQLKGGWQWASGANPRSFDRLYGIWLRIHKDGKLVGEYANPPHIKTKEKWE